MTSQEHGSAGRQSARTPGHFQRKRHGSRVMLSVLIALFCVAAGFLIGAGLTTMHFKKTTRPRPPRSAEMADRIMGRIKDSVSVSQEEEGRIREIILRHMDEVRRIRKESWASIRGQFDGMRQDVGLVLDAERREKWEAEVEKRWPGKRTDADGQEKPDDEGRN